MGIYSRRNIVFWLSFLLSYLAITVSNVVAQNSRIVRVGIHDSKPTVFQDDENNAKGFSVDILEYIAAKQNWQLEYKYGTWSQNMDWLRSGKIDLLFPILRTREREEFFDFSKQTLFSTWGRVFTKSGNDIHTILDLDGKKIAVVKDDFFNQEIRNHIKQFDLTCSFIELDSKSDVLDYIVLGKAEACALEGLAGLWFIKTLDIEPTPIMFKPSSPHFAVQKNKNKDLLRSLDKHLANLKSDKSSFYYTSYESWFGVIHTRKMPKWIWLGILIGIAILLVSVIISIIFRLQIRIKTQSLVAQKQALEKEIEERQKTETKLEESKTLYETLVKTLPDALTVCDFDSIVTYASKRALQLHGFETSEEFVGRSVFEIISPDSKEIAKETFDEAIKTGFVSQVEGILLKKDGTRFYGEITAALIKDTAGNPKNIIGITRDISERKQYELKHRESEERIKQIIESSLDGVIVSDAEGHLIEWNAQAENIFGWSKSEILGRLLQETIIPKQHRAAHKKGMEKFIKTGIGPVLNKRIEVKGLHRKGHEIPIELAITPFKQGGKWIFSGFARDISELKEAEKALRYSELRFQRLAEASFEGIAITENGKMIDCNKQFVEMFGYEMNEILGMNYLDFVADEYREDVFQKRKAGFDKSYEHMAVKRDGSTFMVEAEEKTIPFEDRIVRVTAIRDITERKQAEKALSESEKLNRILVEYAPEAIVILDCDTGLIVDANQKSEQLYGYEKDNLFNMSPVDLSPIKQPNGTSSALIATEKIKESLEKGITTFEWTHKRSNGLEFPCEVNLVRLPQSNKKLIRGSVKDISERKRAEISLKESEEKYRQLFEKDLTGNFIANAEGKLKFCNPAFVEIFGFHSIEHAMNTNLETLYPNTIEFLRLKELLIQDEHLEYHEMEMCQLDGKPVHVIQNIIGDFNESGELKQIQAYLFDNTSRKQLEQQFQQVQKMEAIGTLAGGIAHDFNNILTAILGYADMTLEDLPKKSIQYKNLDAILKAGLRAKDLVTQILTFSRQAEHELKPVRIDLIVKEAIKFLRASLPNTVEIKQFLDLDNSYVLASPTQIHQVVMNLCTNAYHALPSVGGKIELRLEYQNVGDNHSNNEMELPKGSYIKLSVSDNGHGINRETKQRIFDPFFTTKKVGEGTGLGLSVVHGIVNSLNGQITVESEEEEGSTFYIYLPKVNDSTSCQEANPVSNVSSVGAEHILYIDDEKPITEMGEQMLKRLGYSVTVENSSIEALELFKSNPNHFDLVLTDNIMPDLSGTKLARKLLDIRKDLPIILITGFSENLDAEKIEKIGIRNYIAKPIVTAELANAIRKVFNVNKN